MKIKNILVFAVTRGMEKLFPFRNPDPRPVYTFGSETWLQQISRQGNMYRYLTGKKVTQVILFLGTAYLHLRIYVQNTDTK